MPAILGTIKKCIPHKYKENIKKILKLPIDEVITGTSLQEESILYLPQFTRKININFDTNIELDINLAALTRSIDKCIQSKLDSNRYTFQKMLIIKNPYNLTPLTALAVFHTPNPCKVKVTVMGKQEEYNITRTYKEGTTHRVPIMGLYAEHKNTIWIELLDEYNIVMESRKIHIKTGRLAKSLEEVVNVVKSSEKSAYEWIMVAGKSTPFPFAFDQNGDVRYYLSFHPKGYGIFQLTNGRFIFADCNIAVPTFEIPHTTQIYEMDYLGRVHKMYHVAKGCHHDYYEKTPGGNLLTVSNSNEGHVGDVVIELDRNSGEIIKSLDLREVFGDTYRDMVDWAHINTVSYDPKTNTVLVSPRNLHSAFAVDWTTNELKWILCNPKFWKGTPYYDKVLKPEGEFLWHYQQHAVYRLPHDLDGNPDTSHIIMFDNHWNLRRRVKYYDKDDKSYVKIYTINEKAGTVRLDKSYQGVKSKITSNAILEFEKNRVFFMGAYLEPPEENKKGMIYEYDYDTGEVLNQYSLKYFYYRAFEPRFDCDDLATPMKYSEDYSIGMPENIKAYHGEFNAPHKSIPDNIEFDLMIREDIVYMKEKDHTIDHLFFIGEHNKYILDLSKTHQTNELFVNSVYYVAVPIKDLVKDSYKLYVDYLGDRYDTGRWITIK